MECEITVIFNGCDFSIPSTDKVKVLFCEEGLSKARNTGISDCETTFFFPLDADDWLPQNAIQTAYENRPETGFCYGSTMLFRGERNMDDQFLYKAKPYDFRELMKSVYFPNGCLQRKADWELVGGYNENLPFLEDWDYWLKCGEKGICGTAIQDVLYWYRQSNGLVSANKNTAEWESVKQKIKSLHSSIYKGVFPMACCGRKATSSYVPKTFITPENGGSNQVLIQYIGPNFGNMSFWGAVSGKRYVFGATKPKGYVDIEDVQTGLKSKPGFLELSDHGKPIFMEASS